MTGRLRRRGDGEDGAVLVFVALSMTVLMAATSLTVDVGRGSVTKRDLQAVADVVALDAVRALGDLAGEAGGLSVEDHVAELARQSAIRTGHPVDGAGRTLDVAVGVFDPATRTFTATADGIRNAVEITAGAEVAWTFRPGGRFIHARAVAMVGEEAGIAVGSYLARLDSHKSAVLNGLLTGLLGANVTLDAASYQGLAAADVQLGRLHSALGLGAGTVHELLAAEITLAGLLDATASALTAQGDAASVAAASTVATLAASAAPTLGLRLGTLLQVAEGGGHSALSASVNVLQLVQMAAQVADTDHFVSVTLPVVIPGVTNTTLELALIEPPQIAIGPARQDSEGEWVTRATTAQIRAQLRFQFLEVLTVLGQTGTVSLPVYLEGGGSTASLTGIRCAGPPDDGETDVHVSGQAIRAAIGVASTTDLQNAASPLTLAAATIAQIPLVVRVTGTADGDVTHHASTLTFTGPFDWANTQTAGSTTLGLAPLLRSGLALTVTTLTLGVDALAVADDTRAILAALFAAGDEAIFDPLLSALGLSLGGGDVTAWHLACTGRRLAQ